MLMSFGGAAANAAGLAGQSRILVVEDERIVARDLADTLTGLGYGVVGSVASGEAAVQQACTLRPDVVLMDIHLAGVMDGIEAAALIRAAYNVPVVYLTAHGDDRTLRRAQDTEPQAYLMKPFRAADLRCAIEIALHKHAIDARLRDREQLLAITFRSIGDGVLATDARQRVTLLNRVAEKLTGWTHEQALGLRLEEILRFAGPAREPDKGQRSELAGEVLLIGRSGTRTPIDETWAPIVDDQGGTAGNVIVFRDITEQREAARTILRLNADLERRVLERTADLEAAYKDLETFSFSVAHDLRAPVRGMLHFSQALLDDHAGELGGDGLTHLHRVRAAATRMATLIDDLLRLARTASAQLEHRPLDVSAMAWSVVEVLRTLHPERDVAIEIATDIVVDGDFGLVRILLENLIGNAWKFTGGRATPRIEVGVHKDAGARAIFVRDNGTGFDASSAHRLFGAFQRYHPGTAYEGTGIGLAIAQRIVTRHGGRIWAESKLDDGATFSFVLG